MISDKDRKTIRRALDTAAIDDEEAILLLEAMISKKDVALRSLRNENDFLRNENDFLYGRLHRLEREGRENADN